MRRNLAHEEIVNRNSYVVIAFTPEVLCVGITLIWKYRPNVEGIDVKVELIMVAVLGFYLCYAILIQYPKEPKSSNRPKTNSNFPEKNSQVSNEIRKKSKIDE